MDYFDCMFMSTNDLANTNVLTVFVISLLQHLSKSTKSMKPNGSISKKWAKVLSIVYEKLLFYREVICFLINNLFGNVFQTSRVIGLIMLLYVKLRC